MLILFFFTAPATTEIYTLSLHDALPIFPRGQRGHELALPSRTPESGAISIATPAASRRSRYGLGRPGSRSKSLRSDRKSTRLNSSHLGISYAVFCLKKKKKQKRHHI